MQVIGKAIALGMDCDTQLGTDIRASDLKFKRQLPIFLLFSLEKLLLVQKNLNYLHPLHILHTYTTVRVTL